MIRSPPEVDPAEAFRALGHPKRLALVRCLLERESSCCAPEREEDCAIDPASCDFGELAEAVGLSPATVSHHLKELRRTGLIERGRRGRRVFWRVRRPALERLGALLVGAEGEHAERAAEALPRVEAR